MEQNAKRTVFNSMKQLSAVIGIPIDLLKRAKLHPDAPGFNPNNSVDWEALKPWFDEHLEELQTATEDSLEYWKKRKLKAEAICREIEAQQAKENTLNKSEVKDFLRRIGAAQVAILNTKLTKELPPKLAGKTPAQITRTMEDVVQTVCKIFNQELKLWVK